MKLEKVKNNMENIYAIIVSYNPNVKEIEKNLRALSEEVNNIVLVDNSDNIKLKSQLKDCVNTLKLRVDISYLDNKGNIGLSKAQNRGIKYALENENCNWVLLLDDDSFFKSNSINEMMRYFEDSYEKDSIGILVANSIDININTKFKYYVEVERSLKIEQCDENEIKDVLVAMASGSLIKREVFNKIGLMREEFFIDCIDTEYCLRAKKDKYKIKLIGNALLYHKLGEKRKVKFLNKEIAPTNHSPFRCYNIYRNNIIMFREYFEKNKKYFSYQVLVLLNHIVKIIFFETQKTEKLKMIVFGIVAGIKYKKRG